MKIIKENFYTGFSLAEEKSHQRTIHVRIMNDSPTVIKQFKTSLFLPDHLYLYKPQRLYLIDKTTFNVLQFSNSFSTNCFIDPIQNIQEAVDFFWNSPFDVLSEYRGIISTNDPFTKKILSIALPQ